MMLVLGYPPSANRYWRMARAGGAGGRPMTIRSPQADAYKDHVRLTAGRVVPRSGPVALSMVLHPVEPKDAERRARKLGPDWHRSVRCLDIDNCIKVTLDALQGVAYDNDNQVFELLVRRGRPVPNGALVVEVSALGEPAAAP